MTYFYYKNIIVKLFTLQFPQEISVSHLKPSPQNVHLLLNEFAICCNSMKDYRFKNDFTTIEGKEWNLIKIKKSDSGTGAFLWVLQNF